MIIVILVILIIGFFGSLKQINQYERGVKFTLGKFSKVMEPGINFVCPIFQSYRKVDIRTKVVDVPNQEAITKDNVSIPVIASGGAGTKEHFWEALTEGHADAALAASLFHYKELEIADLKNYLADQGVSVRRV